MSTLATATLCALLAAIPQDAAPAATPAQEQPAAPAVSPPVAEPSPQEASRARVEAFLGDLERSGDTIATLSGALSLEKYDAVAEETERRYGRVVVERKDGKRRFAIQFDEFVDSTGRSDRSLNRWIYSDGWLCEQDHRNKSFTKRQIVGPGENFDPLRLGEGPIPLPIGQKRSEVLARFEVAETEVPVDIPMLGSMRNVAGLRLVPKEGTEMAKETERFDLFFDRTTLAPTGIVVVARNGNRTVARISSPVVNGEVKDTDRALLEIPTLDPREWTIDIRALEKK
ncbi:MAG: LolA family protein [Phycisphaerales bacterium]